MVLDPTTIFDMQFLNSHPRTGAEVNRFLKKLGIEEKLIRHPKGYVAWYGGNAAGWYDSSIPVYSITELSYLQYYQDWLDKSQEYQKYR